jgi:hypothetical protein
MDFRLFSTFSPDDLLTLFHIVAFKELGGHTNQKRFFLIFIWIRKTHVYKIFQYAQKRFI